LVLPIRAALLDESNEQRLTLVAAVAEPGSFFEVRYATMKPKTMVLMAIAIVCGLGASYMTSRLLAERGNGHDEAQRVSVLVCKDKVHVGTSLKKAEQLFELKEFTKGTEPKEALVSFDQLKDKFMVRNLRKGDFVTAKDVNDNPQALELPPGMQGSGLRVNAEHIAGGFAATPGSRVDIGWTTKGNNTTQAQSGTLLQNVLVVAADTINTNDERKAIVAQVVTLALLPDDVLKLNLAKEHGTISMAVRRTDEDPKDKVSSITLSQLLKEFSGKNLPPLEQPVPKVVEKPEPKKDKDPPVVVNPKPGKKKHVVNIVEGGKVRTKVYWIYDNGQILLDGHSPDANEEPATGSDSGKKGGANNGPANNPAPGNQPGAGTNPGNSPVPGGSGPGQPEQGQRPKEDA
jgi:Flp pilus assembly protein CpaB